MARRKGIGHKHLSIKMKKIGIRLVLMVLIVLCFWITSGHYDVLCQENQSMAPLIYLKNNQFYITSGNQGWNISGAVLQNPTRDEMLEFYMSDSYFKQFIKTSKDGRTIYFLENIDADHIGDLYIFDAAIGRKKISEKVFNLFETSENGNSAVFFKNVDKQYPVGDMYYYQKGKGVNLIARRIAIIGGYYLSDNGHSMLFCEKATNQGVSFNMYLQKNLGSKELIDTGILIPIAMNTQGDKLLYFKTTMEKVQQKEYSDLYLKAKGMDPVIIARRVSDIRIDKNNFEAYILSDYERTAKVSNLYFMDATGVQTRIDNRVANFPVIDLSLGDNFKDKYWGDYPGVIYFKNMDKQERNADIYVGNRTGSMKVANDASVYYIQAVKDFTTVVYYKLDREKAIYLARRDENKPFFGEEKIADNVLPSSQNLFAEGKVILYHQYSGNKFDLYLLNESGTREKVGHDIVSNYGTDQTGCQEVFLAAVKGRAGGKLYIKKTGKKVSLIDERVLKLFSSDFRRIYYIKNFDWERAKGDLYFKDKDNKPVKIDTDVNAVMPPRSI